MRWSWAQSGPGTQVTGEIRSLDRAVIFAPVGELVPVALEKIRPGGTVAINAIHMSDIPSFPYQDDLWRADAALGGECHLSGWRGIPGSGSEGGN